MTLSQSGQLLASTLSSSVLSLSALTPRSCSDPGFFPPIPGIHPTGAATSDTNVSGTIRSRSLSPAESTFRPSAPAALVPLSNGFPKFDDRSVLCVVGGRTGVTTPPAAASAVTLSNGNCALCTSSVCSATIRRNRCAGRYSFAWKNVLETARFP